MPTGTQYQIISWRRFRLQTCWRSLNCWWRQLLSRLTQYTPHYSKIELQHGNPGPGPVLCESCCLLSPWKDNGIHAPSGVTEWTWRECTHLKVHNDEPYPDTFWPISHYGILVVYLKCVTHCRYYQPGDPLPDPAPAEDLPF